MDILERIFGSASKVKLMKLFIFNPLLSFDSKSLSKKLKIKQTLLRKEINILLAMRLIKKSTTKNEKGKKAKGFCLNPNFIHLQTLRDFLMKISPLSEEDLSDRLLKTGRLKFALVSGVFLNDPESRVDLLIVGDRLKKPALARALSSIESELGKELQYAVFDTSDFEYRKSLGDKLIRDILEYPHKVIYNKLGIGGY